MVIWFVIIIIIYYSLLGTFCCFVAFVDSLEANEMQLRKAKMKTKKNLWHSCVRFGFIFFIFIIIIVIIALGVIVFSWFIFLWFGWASASFGRRRWRFFIIRFITSILLEWPFRSTAPALRRSWIVARWNWIIFLYDGWRWIARTFLWRCLHKLTFRLAQIKHFDGNNLPCYRWRMDVHAF